MMKKSGYLLCSLLVCLAFAGCSRDKGGSEKSSSASGENKAITISFWNGWSGADGEILTEYVDEFNRVNPYGITIEMDINKEFLTKIAAAFVGGQAPDFIIGASSFKDQYTDYLINMNEIFTKTDLKKENWVKGYLDSCTLNDNLYVIPFQVTGRYLFWNKDLFTKAGLDPDKGPASYEEWRQWASLITAEDANVYGSGVPFNSIFSTVHILQRMGGLFLDYNNANELVPRIAKNDGYASFLNWYKGMIDSGDNPVESDTDSMMKAGQIGITVSGAWLTSSLDEAGVNYGVTQLPYGDAGPQNPCSVSGFAVTTSASEEAKIAAYRFIEWWHDGYADTETTGALAWSLTCGFPSYYYPAIADERYKTSDKLASMTNTDGDAVTTYLAPAEFTKTFELANEVIENMIESVVISGVDPYKALDEAQKKTESLQ